MQHEGIYDMLAEPKVGDKWYWRRFVYVFQRILYETWHEGDVYSQGLLGRIYNFAINFERDLGRTRNI
jgi:hypothetical protein